MIACFALQIFVQLDELTGVGEDREWKETARWIKYEEDVEEGSDRWGKPHVASLSFHSLLNLRRCLETGVVLLDLNEKDLPAVAYRVVEQVNLVFLSLCLLLTGFSLQMVVDDLININDKPSVMRSLLLRHRHVNEHQGVLPFTKRKYNSYTSLQVGQRSEVFLCNRNSLSQLTTCIHCVSCYRYKLALNMMCSKIC